MKKIIIGLLLILFVSTSIHAADINITITILEAQIPRVQKILQIYPVPLTDEEDPESDPLYTEKQWFKILITRYIKALVQQVERSEGEQLARDAVSEDEVME